MITSDRRKFLSASVSWRGLLDLMIMLGLLATWLGQLGRWHWFFDLFDHFRLQAVLACSAAALVLGLRRRWVMLGFGLLSLGVNAWPLLAVMNTLPAGVVADEREGMKVICFNALFANTRSAEVRDYLMKSDADVIFLLEFSPEMERALEPLAKVYSYGPREPHPSPWGIGCYSRKPLLGATVKTFADEEPHSIEIIVDAGGRAVRLIATHPWPPTGARSNAVMHRQLRAIAKHVAEQSTMPAIVLGDFNATPWSRAMRELRAGGRLEFRTAQPLWWPTWQVRSPLALPIDHALCTPPLFFARREIGPDLGSDHRPQELIVRWDRSPSS